MCTALFQPFIILTESHCGKDVARNQQPGKLPTKRGPGAATRPGCIRYGGQPDEVLHIQSDWPDVPDWNKLICAFMEITIYHLMKIYLF